MLFTDEFRFSLNLTLVVSSFGKHQGPVTTKKRLLNTTVKVALKTWHYHGLSNKFPCATWNQDSRDLFGYHSATTCSSVHRYNGCRFFFMGDNVRRLQARIVDGCFEGEDIQAR